MQISDQEIDKLDSDKWRDYPAQTIHEQVPTEQRGGAYGRYLTPRRAKGISAMIIRALKITADKIADCGVARRMMLMTFSCGNAPANMAGIIAKYLATSFATENVVSAPRVISNCFRSEE